MLKVNSTSNSQVGRGRTSIAMMTKTSAGIPSPEASKRLRDCRRDDRVRVDIPL
jgi:hypothetical protein